MVRQHQNWVDAAARGGESGSHDLSAEGGYLIAALWDSKESSDRFVSEVLLASMPVEGGYESQPDERAAEVSNYQTRES